MTREPAKCEEWFGSRHVCDDACDWDIWRAEVVGELLSAGPCLQGGPSEIRSAISALRSGGMEATSTRVAAIISKSGLLRAAADRAVFYRVIDEERVPRILVRAKFPQRLVNRPKLHPCP